MFRFRNTRNGDSGARAAYLYGSSLVNTGAGPFAITDVTSRGPFPQWWGYTGAAAVVLTLPNLSQFPQKATLFAVRNTGTGAASVAVQDYAAAAIVTLAIGEAALIGWDEALLTYAVVGKWVLPGAISGLTAGRLVVGTSPTAIGSSPINVVGNDITGGLRNLFATGSIWSRYRAVTDLDITVDSQDSYVVSAPINVATIVTLPLLSSLAGGALLGFRVTIIRSSTSSGKGVTINPSGTNVIDGGPITLTTAGQSVSLLGNPTVDAEDGFAHWRILGTNP